MNVWKLLWRKTAEGSFYFKYFSTPYHFLSIFLRWLRAKGNPAFPLLHLAPCFISREQRNGTLGLIIGLELKGWDLLHADCEILTYWCSLVTSESLSSEDNVDENQILFGIFLGKKIYEATSRDAYSSPLPSPLHSHVISSVSHMGSVLLESRIPLV